MKIFHDNKTWGGKINFVDTNNVFVGFDTGLSWCEFAGWVVTQQEVCDSYNEGDEDEDEAREILDGFVFDTNYYSDSTKVDLDGGGVAIFKLTRGMEVLYLHLFNHHNGYYSHGFTFGNVDGENYVDDSI